MEPQYKFKQFEVVRVLPSESAESWIGLEGVVLGFSEKPNAIGEWTYAVYLYQLEEVISFKESEVEPVGRMDKEETFYSGESITVLVDPKTGEGRIKE